MRSFGDCKTSPSLFHNPRPKSPSVLFHEEEILIHASRRTVPVRGGLKLRRGRNSTKVLHSCLEIDSATGIFNFLLPCDAAKRRLSGLNFIADIAKGNGDFSSLSSSISHKPHGRTLLLHH